MLIVVKPSVTHRFKHSKAAFVQLSLLTIYPTSIIQNIFVLLANVSGRLAGEYVLVYSVGYSQ